MFKLQKSVYKVTFVIVGLFTHAVALQKIKENESSIYAAAIMCNFFYNQRARCV